MLANGPAHLSVFRLASLWQTMKSASLASLYDLINWLQTALSNDVGSPCGGMERPLPRSRKIELFRRPADSPTLDSRVSDSRRVGRFRRSRRRGKDA